MNILFLLYLCTLIFQCYRSEVWSENVWIQDDGLTLGCYLLWTYLNETFPNKWIGQRFYREWPARSPDFTLLDFFLYVYLKNKVNTTHSDITADLKVKINFKNTSFIVECVIASNYVTNISRNTYNKLTIKYIKYFIFLISYRKWWR